jgi:adenylate cyclase
VGTGVSGPFEDRRDSAAGQRLPSSTHVWAGRYNRALDDIFEVLDELTLSIVGAIEPSPRQTEIERAKRKAPGKSYLCAPQHSYQSMMPGEADKALELLHQALAIAPDYPAAHATAPWCYEMRYTRGGMQAADSNAALGHARTAIDLGPDNAASLATAGFVIGLVAHDYTAAIRAIDGALALTRASATALWMGSTVHAHAGDVAKAIEYAERLLRITPFGRDSSLAYGVLAMAYTASDDFAAAVEAAAKAIRANPRFSLLHVLHAAALSRIDRVAEAQAAAARAGMRAGFHYQPVRPLPYRPGRHLGSRSVTHCAGWDCPRDKAQLTSTPKRSAVGRASGPRGQ